MSFLEMLDVVNEELIHAGKQPVELITIVAKESVVLCSGDQRQSHGPDVPRPPVSSYATL